MCLTKHLCNIKLVSLESGKTTAIIKTGLETRLSNTLVVSGFYSTELHLPVHNKPLIGRFREVLNVFGAGEPRRQHGGGGGGQGHVQLSAGGVASATTGSAPAHRSKNTFIASISLGHKACSGPVEICWSIAAIHKKIHAIQNYYRPIFVSESS